jgi:hypothetical protein
VAEDLEIRELDQDEEALDLRVDRYLAGDLSREEAVEFESALAEPELGLAFREELMIRELLQSAPPNEVPAGLNARIAQAVEQEMRAPTSLALDRESGLARRSRIAREGFSWIYRGPAMALAGGPASSLLQAEAGSDPKVGRDTGPSAARRALGSAARGTGRMSAWAIRRAVEPSGPKPSLLTRIRGGR